MQDYKNLINGEWVGASDGKTFNNENPAKLGEVIGTFPSATKEDTRRAIEAARAALPGWANMPPPARGVILEKASRIIEARADELATILTREEGKTKTEAMGEVTRARDIFRYYGGEGFRVGGDVLPSNVSGELLYTRREPLGVIALITPWNFPLAIPAWKMAPALIYGNTVVLKPASLAPHTALAFVEVLVEAGIPKGVVNFITGSGRNVGDEMVSSPNVNGISFTGSTSVGKGIYEKAIKNLTRVQLEMGGKNPMIVLDDANLDVAVRLAVTSGFGVTGQACTAASRVIVEEGIADEFAAALTQAARNLVIGNGR
jgi:aldehyde dehydrogenase (NAD+)